MMWYMDYEHTRLLLDQRLREAREARRASQARAPDSGTRRLPSRSRIRRALR